MQVKSTPTILDAYKQIKELREKIVHIKAEKEILSGEIKTVLLGVQDARQQKKELENCINELTGILEDYNIEVKKAVNEEYDLVREIRKITEEQKREIDNLNIKIGEAKEDFNKIIEKSKEEHQKILLENEQLEVKKKDLNIYKMRLEKIISDNNLSMKIL